MRLNALLPLLLATALSACSSTPPTSDSVPREPASIDADAMEYVDLCDRRGACRKFSRLVMGTDHLVQGGWVGPGQPELTETEAHRVLDEALRLGINFFDTSPIYVGGVEQKLGNWLASRRPVVARPGFYPDPRLNPDRRLYALSKGGFPFDLFYAKKLEAGSHSPELRQALERGGVLAAGAPVAPDGSTPLRAVPPGTYASRLYGPLPQIQRRVAEELGHTRANLHGNPDVYLMHRDDEDFLKFETVRRRQTPVQTILEALSAPALATQYGLVGWSNWQTPRVNESIALASRQPRLARPALNSPYFSLFEMSPRAIHAGGVQVTHAEMNDPGFQRGIKLMSYSPLGGFSIFDKPEPVWENARRSALEKARAGDPYWVNVLAALFTPANEARYRRAVDLTHRFNRRDGTTYTVDQMVNAYALAHRRTDFLAVGPITVEQVRRTVGSLKLARMLTPADLQYLYAGR